MSKLAKTKGLEIGGALIILEESLGWTLYIYIYVCVCVCVRACFDFIVPQC